MSLVRSNVLIPYFSAENLLHSILLGKKQSFLDNFGEEGTLKYGSGEQKKKNLKINVKDWHPIDNECILYPWRYSSRQPSNYRTLQAIGEYAARQARLEDRRLYEVHQASSDKKVAGSLIDYLSGVVGTDLVFMIKPYHHLFPNYTDNTIIETYVNKGISTILSIVRGWRSSSKQNTLSFFGKDVEF